MKVIFLDVDGVLNSHEYVVKKKERGLIGTYDDFVVRLAKIVKETGAKIVMSSCWRSGFLDGKNDHYETHITQRFFKHGIEVYDITPYVKMIRGLEIKEWLSKHNQIERYVIIDDETFNIKDHFPSDVIVKTSFQEGLQDKHVERAIKILKGEEA